MNERWRRLNANTSQTQYVPVCANTASSVVAQATPEDSPMASTMAILTWWNNWTHCSNECWMKVGEGWVCWVQHVNMWQNCSLTAVQRKTESLAQPQKADEESCASIAMPSGFTKTPANGQRSVDGKIKRDPWVLEEFCGLSWSKTLSFHLSLWSPSLWIWSSTEAASNPCRYELSEISNQLEEWGRSTDTWHRSYFGQIMIVLMCHGITLYPCWLHVCQGTKHEHIDTGSGVV